MEVLEVKELTKIYGSGENQVIALDPVSYTHLDVYKRQGIR